MNLKKEGEEWFWADDADTVLSPRFTTKSEACYWLVQHFSES